MAEGANISPSRSISSASGCATRNALTAWCAKNANDSSIGERSYASPQLVYAQQARQRCWGLLGPPARATFAFFLSAGQRAAPKLRDRWPGAHRQDLTAWASARPPPRARICAAAAFARASRAPGAHGRNYAAAERSGERARRPLLSTPAARDDETAYNAGGTGAASAGAAQAQRRGRPRHPAGALWRTAGYCLRGGLSFSLPAG